MHARLPRQVLVTSGSIERAGSWLPYGVPMLPCGRCAVAGCKCDREHPPGLSRACWSPWHAGRSMQHSPGACDAYFRVCTLACVFTTNRARRMEVSPCQSSMRVKVYMCTILWRAIGQVCFEVRTAAWVTSGAALVGAQRRGKVVYFCRIKYDSVVFGLDGYPIVHSSARTEKHIHMNSFVWSRNVTEGTHSPNPEMRE